MIGRRAQSVWTPGLASVQALFLASDVGVFYDFATAAQVKEDSLAQVPAAVDGPVGAMLDLSGGLEIGPERLQSSSDMTLTGGGTYIGGALECFRNADSTVWQVGKVNAELGKVFQVAFTLEAHPGGYPVRVAVRDGDSIGTGGNADVAFTVPGSYTTIVHRKHPTVANIQFVPTPANNGFRLTNISIKEIKGSHAFQPTTANKPTLRRTPTTGRYWIDAFDNARSLNATFATAPGEMHVGRVTPEGMVWVTETWAATQNVITQGQYNAGIVARKRVFTAPEMALIEAYFRRQLPSLGPNLFADPGFDSAGAWAVGGGWSVSGSIASRSVAAASNLTQSKASLNLDSVDQIFIGFDALTLSAGAFSSQPSRIVVAKTVLGRRFGAGIADTAVDFGVRAFDTTVGTVDNLFIRKIL